MITIEKFLTRVDRFKQETGRSDFQIGMNAAHDHKLLERLRSGADLRTRTMDRIDEWMRKEKKKCRKKTAR